MHDFKRNVNDRNLKQSVFVYYQRQCLGSEPKLFHNYVYTTSEIYNYIVLDVKTLQNLVPSPGPLYSEACGGQRPWQRLVVT